MAGLIFIGLNIADSFLTGLGFELGAREINPLPVLFGGSMLLKGLIAATIVFILYYFGKEKWLWYLNFAFFAVVLFNLGTCFIQGIV